MSQKGDLLFDGGLEDLSSHVQGQKFCKLKTTAGFHAADPYAMTTEIKNLQECVLLCLKFYLCLSGNFMEQDNSTSICMMHSSSASVLNHIVLTNSIYFDFRCDAKPNIVTNHLNPMPPPKQCGLALTKTEPDRRLGQNRLKRIVGGFETQFYSQPWYGSLLLEGRHVCGVTLIVPTPGLSSTVWAITAAHCFPGKRGGKKIENVQEYLIMFGNQDWRVFTPYIIVRELKSIQLNSYYTNGSSQNDLAVIELAEKVTFNQFVLPICLPDADTEYTDWLAGAMCHICGWGLTTDSNDRGKVHNPFRMHCINSHARPSLNDVDLLFETSMASTFTGANSGDSGGADACRGKGKGPAILMGIANGQNVYKYHRDPSHYYYHFYHAFVPCYVTWIKGVMKGVGCESKKSCFKCW